MASIQLTITVECPGATGVDADLFLRDVRHALDGDAQRFRERTAGQLVSLVAEVVGNPGVVYRQAFRVPPGWFQELCGAERQGGDFRSSQEGYEQVTCRASAADLRATAQHAAVRRAARAARRSAD